MSVPNSLNTVEVTATVANVNTPGALSRSMDQTEQCGRPSGRMSALGQ